MCIIFALFVLDHIKVQDALDHGFTSKYWFLMFMYWFQYTLLFYRSQKFKFKGVWATEDNIMSDVINMYTTLWEIVLQQWFLKALRLNNHTLSTGLEDFLKSARG